MSDDEEDEDVEQYEHLNISVLIGSDDDEDSCDFLRQVQSPDSHDSGIHVEYVRPEKAIKRTHKKWEPPPPPPPREEEPKRKLPPGWEQHEG